MSNNARQQEPQPPSPASLSTSATTCIVGCKLPHGLRCELKRQDGKIEAHVLKGMNDSRIVGGYGLTEGIPTEFMKEWLSRNSEHPAVKNGSVFMHTSAQGAKARAREGRETRTGLEPIDPTSKSVAAKHGLVNDDESQKAYRKQVAENPDRNRQIQE